MPYIKKEQRQKLASGQRPSDPGELNYTITRLLLTYLKDKGKSYASFNEIMGVLSCVGQEFYRRWVAPYEDQKILENGDVEPI
jgi:uncharacterized protein DUF6899